MKRLFHERGSSGSYEQNILGDARAAAGKGLRKFLWLSYLTGKTVDANFLGHLAWHIRECGGQGVEDFAVNPNSDMGHARVKLILGREFDDPELEYVNTAVHDTKSNQRSEARVPIHLPSVIFKREYKDFQEPAALITEPAEDTTRFDCARWHEHSVRKKAAEKKHWSRIIPSALYWDGVQFQNRDNFFVICIRNLRTNVSHPMIILRRTLRQIKSRKRAPEKVNDLWALSI